MQDLLVILDKFGIPGICLGMMFYICFFIVSKLNQTLGRLDRSIMSLVIMITKKELDDKECQDSGRKL